MHTITFRNAIRTDLERIVAIYNSTISSRLVTADTEPVSIESKVEWFEKHSPDKRPIWVIEDASNQIIGWVSFQSFYGRPAYNETVEISIYLDENQRGKGLGEFVLKHCIKEAPKFGIKTLLGFIFSYNLPSLNLFKKLGFKEWGKFPDIAVMDNQSYSLSILGKRLID